MNLLLAPFSSMPESLVAFAVSIAVVTLMIGIMLKAVLSTRGRRKWVKAITNVNAKFLFTFLFIGWAIFFGITPAARPARRRELAVRRDRPDRPVHAASSS